VLKRFWQTGAMIVKAEPLETLRTRTSMKWAAYAADVLPLPVAEMDFPLAEPIASVLTDAIRRSDTGYAPPTSELPAAFAGFAEARWGWTVDPEQVFTTTDVSVAIVETLRRVASPGDGVIVNSPVYFPFYAMLEEAGVKVVDVPLAGGLDEGWSLDLAGIERAFEAGATTYLLCNPHNPVGVVHSADQLRAVAAIARKYGATVVSDEIHGPLVYPGVDFTPFLAASDDAREVGVCVTAASKGWNLAGLKTALMVTAGGRAAPIIAGMPVAVYWRASILGVHAGIAAYRDSVDWLDGVISSLDENRMLLRDLLAEHLPEVGYRMPDATFLAWLDLRGLGWGDDPAVHALEVAKVALSNGPPFGPAGVGFARLNLACSPEVLTEAVTRLAAAR
jgi:cystathionine beta-lyase